MHEDAAGLPSPRHAARQFIPVQPHMGQLGKCPQRRGDRSDQGILRQPQTLQIYETSQFWGDGALQVVEAQVQYFQMAQVPQFGRNRALQPRIPCPVIRNSRRAANCLKLRGSVSVRGWL